MLAMKQSLLVHVLCHISGEIQPPGGLRGEKGCQRQLCLVPASAFLFYAFHCLSLISFPLVKTTVLLVEEGKIQLLLEGGRLAGPVSCCSMSGISD